MPVNLPSNHPIKQSIAATAAVPVLAGAVAFALVAGGSVNVSAQQAQPACQTFKETGKTACGRFLDYWQRNGGLAQQGFPISDERQERSETDGKTYTVQYFERAVFELHPENPTPYDVLLSLLGNFEYKKRYGEAGAPGQKASTDNPRLFKETGKTVGGKFRAYWEQHGALAQQGFPISDEFQEVSALDGKTYTVQYFERAVFELHPENPAPYDVLLSQLGTFRYRSLQTSGATDTRPAVATPTRRPLPPTPLPTAPLPLNTLVPPQPVPTTGP